MVSVRFKMASAMGGLCGLVVAGCPQPAAQSVELYGVNGTDAEARVSVSINNQPRELVIAAGGALSEPLESCPDNVRFESVVLTNAEGFALTPLSSQFDQSTHFVCGDRIVIQIDPNSIVIQPEQGIVE